MRTRAQKVVGFLTSGSLLWLGLVFATMSSAANQFAPSVMRVGNVINQAGSGMTIKGEAPDGECRRFPHNISLTRHQISASLFARWTMIDVGAYVGLLQPDLGESLDR